MTAAEVEVASAEAALVDGAVRRRIALVGLDELLFVEAGAGTGKTKQLVDRVVSLVLRRGVAMREIAAITFTEAAASELRSRIREAFERQIHDPATDAADRVRGAPGTRGIDYRRGQQFVAVREADEER